MDRQLLERMIGAGVLMLALVVIAPVILDRKQDAPNRTYNGIDPAAGRLTRSAQPAGEMRTHTIILDREPDGPPVARPMAEPVAVTDVADDAARRDVIGPAVETDRDVSKPATKVRPASPAVASAGWAVQLGSFADQRNALRLADKVRADGHQAYLVPLERQGKVLYRVRVGPRDTRAQATELADRLAGAGYPGQVIPPQPEA